MRKTRCCLCGLLILLVMPANGSPASGHDYPHGAVTLEEVEGGALLAPAGGTPARYVPLPGLRTDVRIAVTGIAAQVEIEQVFHNPSTSWMEGVYVFPLPSNSALTGLRMRVADRVIEGVVKEKERAREQYQNARQAGRKAGLVTQQRPNLFTSRVANIPPGESIAVTLTYHETVSRTGDAYSLRVPLVAGPRYRPPADPARDPGGRVAGVDSRRWSNPNTIPPALGEVNPVSVAFRLDAGFELDSVASTYHPMTITRSGDGRANGMLAGRHYADRDFELRWQPVSGAQPAAAVFVDRQGAGDYVLVMLQPPRPGAAASSSPRELILIIDASGSMHGDSIEQALAAARFALSTLGERDRFNLVRFSDRPTMLFPSPQPAGPAALAQAERFLSGTVAGGGTNMAAALRRAFDNPGADGAVRQLVFLTDGAVGNEAELFAMIKRGTASSRLFPVGMGSAPNGYFMHRAARVGRGTYTFIGASSEVAAKMAALFERIRKPMLTDIHVDWRGAAVLDGVDRVPDLYDGEPVTLTARVEAFRGVTLHGRHAGRSWSRGVDAGASRAAPWVSTLWARERIRQLKNDLLGGGDRDAVAAEITRLGLDHQLVTPYTSLVAIERRISRSESDPLFSADAPVNLPQGWSYRHVFGSLPQTGSGWRSEAALGIALLAFAMVLLWHVRTRPRLSP